MKTMAKKNKSDKGSERKRLVCDLRGTIYELKNKLSEGGQGVVCHTQFPNVLVKVSKFPKEDPRSKAWFDHLQWVSRQPLDGLKIARPQALIDKPRHGYVMELMDGLEPLQHLLGLSLEASKSGNGPHFFIESGGLSRRLRLLTALARTLAELHGRGLAYGDLAPGNVFVSRSREHAEVWLIDSDNISVLSREGGQKIYTPEYGAPEIIRGISGIDSLTDSWSFGVIAFQLLTLQHPLIGDIVSDGDPDDEERALKGELPWIDDPDDDSNRASSGIHRDWVLTKELQRLCHQCFGPGRNTPEARPTMSEWRAAFEAAATRVMNCSHCGSGFYFNRDSECNFCDHVQEDAEHVLMLHYLYTPVSEEEQQAGLTEWIKTGHVQVLGREPLELRASPVGTTSHAESELVCTLTMKKDDGLYIEPVAGVAVALQSQKSQESKILTKRMRLKETSRRGDTYMLHLSDSADTPHYAWRFKW